MNDKSASTMILPCSQCRVFFFWIYTNSKQTLPPTKFLKCLRAFLNGLLWAAEKSPTGEVAGSPEISRFLLSTSSKVLRREGDRSVGEGVEGSCKQLKKQCFINLHNLFFFNLFQNLINSNTEWPIIWLHAWYSLNITLALYCIDKYSWL